MNFNETLALGDYLEYHGPKTTNADDVVTLANILTEETNKTAIFIWLESFNPLVRDFYHDTNRSGIPTHHVVVGEEIGGRELTLLLYVAAKSKSLYLSADNSVHKNGIKGLADDKKSLSVEGAERCILYSQHTTNFSRKYLSSIASMGRGMFSLVNVEDAVAHPVPEFCLVREIMNHESDVPKYLEFAAVIEKKVGLRLASVVFARSGYNSRNNSFIGEREVTIYHSTAPLDGMNIHSMIGRGEEIYLAVFPRGISLSSLALHYKDIRMHKGLRCPVAGLKDRYPLIAKYSSPLRVDPLWGSYPFDKIDIHGEHLRIIKAPNTETFDWSEETVMILAPDPPPHDPARGIGDVEWLSCVSSEYFPSLYDAMTKVYGEPEGLAQLRKRGATISKEDFSRLAEDYYDMVGKGQEYLELSEWSRCMESGERLDYILKLLEIEGEWPDSHVLALTLRACSLVPYSSVYNRMLNAVGKIDSPTRSRAYAMLEWCHDLLSCDSLYRGEGYSLLDLDEPKKGSENRKMNTLNPSLIAVGDRVLCNVRNVNYTLEMYLGHGMVYETHDKDGRIRTKNCVCQLDSGGRVITQQLLLENKIISNVRVRANIRGMEDVRLIGTRTSRLTSEKGDVEVVCFSCTRADWQGYQYPLICYGEFLLSDVGKDHDIEIQHMCGVKIPGVERVEKNHVMHIHDNKIYDLYSNNPTTTYELEPESGRLTHIHTQPSIRIPLKVRGRDLVDCPSVVLENDSRGGASPILLDSTGRFGHDLWVAPNHEVIFRDRVRRYHTRFMGYRREFHQGSVYFTVTHSSEVFKILGENIEYCSGICLDPLSDDVLLSMGIDDKDHLVARVRKETVLGMMMTPEQFASI